MFLIVLYSDSYENGIAKVKLAEQFSDIDSSDIDNNTSKKSRRIRARKCSDSEDDNDCQSTLPPPPKKPVIKTLSVINPQNKIKLMETSSPLQNKIVQKRNITANTVQSVQDSSKQHSTEASVSKDSNSAIILADIGI